MTYEKGDPITYRRRLAWSEIETGVVVSVGDYAKIDVYCVKPDEPPGCRGTIVYQHEVVKDGPHKSSS